jgi:hypothetical protein
MEIPRLIIKHMKAIELNAKEITRIQVILGDYLNDQRTGHIELDRDFVTDNKTFVTIFIEGYYSKDESFRYGQMRENAEFECETFLVFDGEDVEHIQDASLLSFSESETFDHLGGGSYI